MQVATYRRSRARKKRSRLFVALTAAVLGAAVSAPAITLWNTKDVARMSNDLALRIAREEPPDSSPVLQAATRIQREAEVSIAALQDLAKRGNPHAGICLASLEQMFSEDISPSTFAVQLRARVERGDSDAAIMEWVRSRVR